MAKKTSKVDFDPSKLASLIVLKKEPETVRDARGPLGFPVDETISSLLRRIYLKTVERYRTFYKVYDIALEFWGIFSALLVHGSQTVTSLADRTGLEVSTASYMLKRMEERGFISRVKSKSDARALVIELTPLGLQTAEELIPISLRFEQIICEGLPEADIEAMRKHLKLVLANVQSIEMREPD